MQAADVMVFPSLFEGFRVTLVEAQAAGLPVLMADTVTEEVILTDLVQSLPLSVLYGRTGRRKPVRWRLAKAGKRRGRTRVEYVSRNGYDAAAKCGEAGLPFLSAKAIKTGSS